MRTIPMMLLSCAIIFHNAPVWAQDEGPAAADTGETATYDVGGSYGGGGYPAPEILRPLTLPHMMLEARGGLLFLRTPNNNSIAIFAGVGFGVVDGLEIGLGGLNTPVGGRFGVVAGGGSTPGLPLLLSPSVDFLDIPVYGMYDLSGLLGIDGFDLAARLTLNLPVQTNFQIIVDTPLRLRINHLFAVIGTAIVGAQLGDNASAFLIGGDAGVLIQPNDMIALMATFGVVGVAGDASTALIPLAFRGEFNLMDPFDVYVEFSFPELNNAGGDVFLVMGGIAYRVGF